LLVNGVAYLAISATGLLLPQHLVLVSTITTPARFGAVALMLWLLIVGVRETSPPRAPAATREAVRP